MNYRTTELALVLLLASSAGVHSESQRSGTAQAETATTQKLAIELDMAASSIDLADDGRYVVHGVLVNTGTEPGSTTILKLVFCKGHDVLGEKRYPLVEGPIAPKQRLAFSLPFHGPPKGTTN